jgi:hypothetical protein
MSVDHAAVLSLLDVLPDGVTSGNQQIAHRDGLIITASLIPSIEFDVWEGVMVRVHSPLAGELGSNRFAFETADLFPDKPIGRLGWGIDLFVARGMQDGEQDVRLGPLRDGVARYLAVFTDAVRATQAPAAHGTRRSAAAAPRPLPAASATDQATVRRGW